MCAIDAGVSQPPLQMEIERTFFYSMAPHLLSILVTFDIENESCAVKSPPSPEVAVFLYKPNPREVTILRDMRLQFYDYRT